MDLDSEFKTSIFSQSSQFYEELGYLWVTEAEIQEILSLLLPELFKLELPILADFGVQLQEKLEGLKVYYIDACLLNIESYD
jgi:hypothetical protein